MENKLLMNQLLQMSPDRLDVAKVKFNQFNGVSNPILEFGEI